MELDRFKAIIETYGSHDDRWPAMERDAALQLVAKSAEARQFMAREQLLDNMLDNLPAAAVNTDKLARRILEQAQPSLLERLINWLIPDLQHTPRQLWRPALAAALPLVMGIAIGIAPWQDTANLTSAEEIYLTAITGETYGDWYDE